MFHCQLCGNTESRQELVSEDFDIDGRPERVEQIPAMVCIHSGEPVFSRDSTEQVRRMVHGEATKPIQSIQMDVFACRQFLLVPDSLHTRTSQKRPVLLLNGGTDDLRLEIGPTNDCFRYMRGETAKNGDSRH